MKKKKLCFGIILPIEKSIKPIHRTVFERPKPNKINEGIRIKIPQNDIKINFNKMIEVTNN